MRVRWTDSARRDLQEIAIWIARDRPQTAREVVAALRASVRHLAEHPQLGRVVPEIGAESLRERVVTPWRILYRVHEREIVILAVVHGRRELRG